VEENLPHHLNPDQQNIQNPNDHGIIQKNIPGSEILQGNRHLIKNKNHGS